MKQVFLAMLFTGTASVLAAQEKNPVNVKEFYKANPAVKTIYWQHVKAVTLQLKDGTTEKYNLTNENETAAFLKKYNSLPIAPPPPPPLVIPPPPAPRPEMVKCYEANN